MTRAWFLTIECSRRLLWSRCPGRHPHRTRSSAGGDGRAEKSDVADRRRITEQCDGEANDIIEVEELDRFVHSPSRRKASLWVSMIRSAACATRSR